MYHSIIIIKKNQEKFVCDERMKFSVPVGRCYFYIRGSTVIIFNMRGRCGSVVIIFLTVCALSEICLKSTGCRGRQPLQNLSLHRVCRGRCPRRPAFHFRNIFFDKKADNVKICNNHFHIIRNFYFTLIIFSLCSALVAAMYKNGSLPSA